MKTPRLQPIPTPPLQRLQHFKTTFLPGLIFCGALVIIGFLWRDRMAAPTMVGQADGDWANVSSHQAGVLAELRVTRFQKVRAGEPLVKVLNAEPKLAEAQLNPVQLCAPMDGTVTAIHFRPGEFVTPGQPIVTIATDEPTRIIGYLRPSGGGEPKSGAQVLVRSRGGQRLTGTAQVIEVGSQLEVLPPALQSSVKLAGAELALPVNISLPAGLDLRPGELVDLSIIPSTQ